MATDTMVITAITAIAATGTDRLAGRR
ncbi:hypothetical protein FHX61_005721 [Cupriavidus alkaliphilus]|uniref:Uncharacterized protein n=1 Tax=Cupriavidus alkaliphilus TaxID=942866 RepID=A0A7W4VG66_9BURK|nr:hypothetical protein [Cupriavidus alkaliphilus]